MIEDMWFEVLRRPFCKKPIVLQIVIGVTVIGVTPPPDNTNDNQ